MAAAQYLPDAEFAPAPAGARVRLATMLSSVVVVLAIVAAVVLMARDRHPPPRPVFGAVAVIPVAFALAVFAGRMRRYRLVGGELRMEFLFRTVRFPLAGLVSATADREAMRHAWRMYGNDGLGGISGRFRSKRLGFFRAYLTDPEHAVVLRWPGRCLVISPDHPSSFIEAVRKRAGLSR
jgi:hypothetical protein